MREWDGIKLNTGDKAGMMFNTDFELFYNVTVSRPSGEPNCDVQRPPQPSEATCDRNERTFSTAKLYSEVRR